MPGETIIKKAGRIAVTCYTDGSPNSFYIEKAQWSEDARSDNLQNLNIEDVKDLQYCLQRILEIRDGKR